MNLTFIRKISFCVCALGCSLSLTSCRSTAQPKPAPKATAAPAKKSVSLREQILYDARIVSTLPLARQRALPALAKEDIENFSRALGDITQEFNNPDGRAYAAYLIGEYRLVNADAYLLTD